MATVSPPRPKRTLEQDHLRVRSPLGRVRSFIYRYVGIEGLALVGLFLALWFWIGLVLDYGIFKLFLFDWVQETPWAARCTVLVLVLSGLLALLATTVFVRLFREFTDSAMALVLEKRFPDILGDRLITAVELSDPEAAAAFGYSPALVRETIHEAAERVDQVPISQVFDWKRLIRRGVIVALLSLGLYAIVASGFCVARSLNHEGAPMAGIGDFNDVATIWTERNILLRNAIWPRRAHLEILPFEGAVGLEGTHAPADPTELRIPQGTQPPALRVRAWKYIIADKDAPEGWRLLTWHDLSDQPGFVGGLELPKLPDLWEPREATTGMTVDEVEMKLEAFPIRKSAGEGTAKWSLGSETEESGVRPLMWADLSREKLSGLDVPGIPGAWDHRAKSAMIAGGVGNVTTGTPFGAAAGMVIEPKSTTMTVDEVEKQLEKAEKAGKPDPAIQPVRAVFDRLAQLVAIRATLDKIGETASDRAMRRTVRKLIVPDQVTLVYRGMRSTNTSTMTRIAGNEFTGNFAELKETVSYIVRGEDYMTARRTITVVERPRVDSLESEEERPAYLYYRPAKDSSFEEIRLKRQPLEAAKLSVSSDTTTMEAPVGTYVTLRGMLSKPLYKIDFRVEPKDKKTFSGNKPEIVDTNEFAMTLPNLRREQKFTLLFTDTDGVTGERKIIILPRPDTTPRVGEFNPDEAIRKGRANEGFLIAAGCRIPFKGRVGDDHGLARVRYAIRVTPADFLSEQKLRGLFAVGALPLFAPGGSFLQGTGYLMALNQEIAGAAKDESGPEQTFDLPAFEQAVTRGKMDDGRPEVLERGTIATLLASKQKANFRKLTREFSLTPDKWSESFAEKDEDINFPSRWYKANDFRSPLGCDLPLWRLTYRDRDGKDRPLKDPDDTKPQKRFVVEVRLLVDDNYLDGDLDARKQPIPNTGASGETFTFTVVPENELLSRMAEEEEIKFREMEKAVKPVRDNLDRLREIHFSLSAGPGSVDANNLTSYIARCDTLGDVLKTSHQDVKGVFTTYEKILKEMRINQLSEDIQTKVYRTIYKPLDEVSSVQFQRTIDEVVRLRRAMDDPSKGVPERVVAAQPLGASSRKELNDLVNQLNAILVAMEGLAKINDLILELARIERQEEDLEASLQKVYRDLLKKLLEGKDK